MPQVILGIVWKWNCCQTLCLLDAH